MNIGFIMHGVSRKRFIWDWLDRSHSFDSIQSLIVGMLPVFIPGVFTSGSSFLLVVSLASKKPTLPSGLSAEVLPELELRLRFRCGR